MSAAAMRSEIQRAILAAIEGRDELYRTGAEIETTPEKAEFCARTTELVLKAMSKSERDKHNARRGGPQPRPATKRPSTNGKPFDPIGIIGRPAKEVIAAVANGEGDAKE